FETLLTFLAIYLQQSSNDGLRTIAQIIIALISLPLSLIDRTYPYYSMNPGWIVAMLIIITLLIHTMAIFSLYKAVKKPAGK
ncbi:MAG TPA: hypothetical protein VEA37_06335, partial [Flavobacterium sp.]|nr:hypothetical protein [Flavobacterium sp.]